MEQRLLPSFPAFLVYKCRKPIVLHPGYGVKLALARGFAGGSRWERSSLQWSCGCWSVCINTGPHVSAMFILQNCARLVTFQTLQILDKTLFWHWEMTTLFNSYPSNGWELASHSGLWIVLSWWSVKLNRHFNFLAFLSLSLFFYSKGVAMNVDWWWLYCKLFANSFSPSTFLPQYFFSTYKFLSASYMLSNMQKVIDAHYLQIHWWSSCQLPGWWARAWNPMEWGPLDGLTDWKVQTLETFHQTWRMWPRGKGLVYLPETTFKEERRE
jgi:hypothetical protein